MDKIEIFSDDIKAPLQGNTVNLTVDSIAPGGRLFYGNICVSSHGRIKPLPYQKPPNPTTFFVWVAKIVGNGS